MSAVPDEFQTWHSNSLLFAAGNLSLSLFFLISGLPHKANISPQFLLLRHQHARHVRPCLTRREPRVSFPSISYRQMSCSWMTGRPIDSSHLRDTLSLVDKQVVPTIIWILKWRIRSSILRARGKEENIGKTVDREGKQFLYPYYYSIILEEVEEKEGANVSQAFQWNMSILKFPFPLQVEGK